jgi:hypothetical protein
MDIMMKPTRKMLTRQESAVVRLLGVAHGLLAHRRVRVMRDR